MINPSVGVLYAEGNFACVSIDLLQDGRLRVGTQSADCGTSQNTVMAQFVVHADFPAVVIDGDFDKRTLDPVFVENRERLLTRGWQRLRELADQDGVSLLEYPLPEVRDRMRRAAEGGE